MAGFATERTPEEQARQAAIHEDQLLYELDRNDQRITILQEDTAKKRVELDGVRTRRKDAERIIEGAREVGQATAEVRTRKRRPKDPPLDEGVARDAAVRLQGWTIPELAATVGVKPGTVKPLVLRWVERGAVRETGDKFQGQMFYEWQKADEPGAAFEVQQQQREADKALAPEREAAQEVMRNASLDHLKALPKPVRTVVRQAIRDGWQLDRTGGDHFSLTKPGHESIGAAGTPRDADTAAAIIRRKLRQGAKRATTG